MDILQEEILTFLKKTDKKYSFNELKKQFKLKGEEEEYLLWEILNILIEEGKVYQDQNGLYTWFNCEKLNKIQGKIYISKKGNGYVNYVDENGKEFSYLIHNVDLNGAIYKDTVVISDFTQMKSGFVLAKVEKIIKREFKKVVFEYLGNGQFTIYNRKSNLTLKVDKEDCEGLVYGDRVLVALDKNNIGDNNNPVFEGEILTVIGHKDDPKIDIATIAYDFGFTTKFSKEALKELESIPSEVLEEEKEGRVDLTDEVIFTIDGDDTKDIDDAISIKKEGDFYILGVHIADVSHYVKPGMALFEDAKARATSAYLLDYVIPMLPHRLSNGICSLNPNEERLAISCEMKIDKNGKIVDYNIFESVIKSRKQMTYNAVNKILEENEMVSGYEEFTSKLNLMKELSNILEKAKIERGAIDFLSEELKIKTDDKGDPIELQKRKQRTGEKLIENFMLAANETIATNYNYLNVPFVYRIHDKPNIKKLTEALEFLKSEKIISENKVNQLLAKASNNMLCSYDIANILRLIEDEKCYRIVSNMILCSMSKAVYSNHNQKHYALSLDNYTHFTSPIRRFPDLMVHTLIKEYKDFENIDLYRGELKDICENSSFMERQADKAEKAANKLKMAEYMNEHIGEVFEGEVVCCNKYGLNVILDNLIRGYVDFEDILDGKYFYGKESHQLVNKANKKLNYKIGDRVFVLVKDVSIPYRTINFYASKENNFSKSKVKTKRRTTTLK